jgi:hypothetical protein
MSSCSTALLAQQVASAEISVDISSQPLESALQQFALQTGLQVLFSSEEDAMQHPAPAISGVHTPRQALEQLLADTGLKYTYINSRTVAISENPVKWRDGYIVFEDAALGDVVAEFNRHNARKIYIEDASLAQIRLGGNFRFSNAEAFLWLLQKGFPIVVEQSDDRISLKWE